MSTIIRLHIRHEEMTDGLLKQHGHIQTEGNIIDQLGTHGTDSNTEEWYTVLESSNSIRVGVSYGEESLADELKGYLQHVTPITDELIEDITDMVEYYNETGNKNDNEDVVEWLEKHQGESVFSIAY